jgi:hypothetical protein
VTSSAPRGQSTGKWGRSHCQSPRAERFLRGSQSQQEHPTTSPQPQRPSRGRHRDPPSVYIDIIKERTRAAPDRPKASPTASARGDPGQDHRNPHRHGQSAGPPNRPIAGAAAPSSRACRTRHPKTGCLRSSSELAPGLSPAARAPSPKYELLGQGRRGFLFLLPAAPRVLCYLAGPLSSPKTAKKKKKKPVREQKLCSDPHPQPLGHPFVFTIDEIGRALSFQHQRNPFHHAFRKLSLRQAHLQIHRRQRQESA